jgi:hypothetical protein
MPFSTIASFCNMPGRYLRRSICDADTSNEHVQVVVVKSSIDAQSEANGKQ